MKYNHAYTIAFSLISKNAGENVTEAEILAGLKNKIKEFISCPGSLEENAGLPFDSYTVEGE